MKYLYKAIVNGKDKMVEVPGTGIKQSVGSEDNFFLRAENDSEALILARQYMNENGLKEKKFKGVIRLEEKAVKATS